MGKDLRTPVDFVLYWAPVKYGQVQGGTATAVKAAAEMGVKAINMSQKGWRDELVEAFRAAKLRESGDDGSTSPGQSQGNTNTPDGAAEGQAEAAGQPAGDIQPRSGPPLEVSSAGPAEGKALSAMFLKFDHRSVESVYQGSKNFTNGGPKQGLYELDGFKAKAGVKNAGPFRWLCT